MRLKRFKTKSFICALILLTGAFCLLFFTLSKRENVYADAAPGYSENELGFFKDLTLTDLFEAENDASSYADDDSADVLIRISLPDDVYYEDISFENLYMQNSFVVKIKTNIEDFFSANPIYCDLSKTKNARYLYDAGNSEYTIIFLQNGLYEYTPEFHDREITVKAVSSRAAGKKIIVIDPVYSGASDDTSLLLAEQIRFLAQESASDIRIYLTRTGAKSADSESVIRFIEENGAVAYLSLISQEGNASPRASAYFNDSYFISGYGNLSFAADSLESLSRVQGISLTGVYTIGTISSTENAYSTQAFILNTLKIPGALLRIDGLDFNDSNSDAVGQTALTLLNVLEGL